MGTNSGTIIPFKNGKSTAVTPTSSPPQAANAPVSGLMFTTEGTESLTELAEDWLRSLGCTLWADWDVSRDDRRRLAAEWFVNSMQQFIRYMS